MSSIKIEMKIANVSFKTHFDICLNKMPFELICKNKASKLPDRNGASFNVSPLINVNSLYLLYGIWYYKCQF